MNFIEELKWRGMLHDSTPEIEAHLNSKKCVGYIGFDPTAPSMTIGNYVQIMLLRLFQLSGHQPIVLMGGATGRIGDPSGKDKERELKSFDELDSNLQFQMEQVKKFLDFEGENKALIINNLDFYKNMNVLDFLRDVGKTLTVNYMSSKDSVKNRVETGLSFTEFSYQLLQAYDFQCLFSKYDCSIQMGGSDQWGNITSGTEFIRRNLNQKAYAVTTPLLTKADGKKFGKSEQGNIWLDEKLTSPYKFYQFWINADDRDLPNFFKYFTLKSKAEFDAIWEEHGENPQQLKRLLAEELTCRVHSPAAYESVLKVSDLLFNKKATAEALSSMTSEEFETVAGEIITFQCDHSIFDQAINIIDLLTGHTSILQSKGEARKAIANNAIAINKVKVNSIDHTIHQSDLLQQQYLMIENGKKNKFLLKTA